MLVADPRRRDLSGFRPNQKLRPAAAAAAAAACSHGADGDDAMLACRSGRRCSTTRAGSSPTSRIRGARVVVAKGGTGGRGNKHFAAPTRQTPRFAEVGLPGEEGEIELRLKLLADAALVGLPNAGKSSLLARISNARPKVADYPFTTLSPVLGTVESPDGRQLTVADVPGLIEGASEGIGLGHEFLAHLERARLLLHVIDSSEGDADERWRTIDTELAAYGAGLDKRPQVVVLNKIDLSPEPPAFDVEDERIVRVLRVSAATGAGIDELQARALRARAAEEEVVRRAPRGRARRLPRLPAAAGAARASASSGRRAASASPAAAARRRSSRRSSRRPGAREGDEVEMGEEMLEWQ